MVVCGHAYGFLHLVVPDYHVAFFDRVERGGLWVSGFFVLSGYCIVAGSGRPEAFDFRRYMAARVSRILPLYLLFLAVTVVAEVVFARVGGRAAEQWMVFPWTLLSQLTMTQGLFGSFGAYNPSWSLTRELVCYLIWGALIVVTGRRMHGLAILAFALLPLVAAALVHAIFHDENSWRLLTLPFYFFVWLLGAATADSRSHIDDSATRCRLALGLVVVVPLFAWYVLDLRVPDTVGMIAFSLILAVAAFFLPSVGALGPCGEALCRWLGLASYPLYLGHGIVLVGLTVWPIPADPFARAVVGVALSTVLALVGGVPLERVTLRRRAAWMKRRFPSAT